jgi:hypothetical protein
MMEEPMISSTDQTGKNELGDTYIQWYSSTLTDYIYKTTIATVLFFISCPWAAFFWPPYYFMKRLKE